MTKYEFVEACNIKEDAFWVKKLLQNENCLGGI